MAFIKSMPDYWLHRSKWAESLDLLPDLRPLETHDTDSSLENEEALIQPLPVALPPHLIGRGNNHGLWNFGFSGFDPEDHPEKNLFVTSLFLDLKEHSRTLVGPRTFETQIQNYLLFLGESSRIELAKIKAAHSGMRISQSINLYGIQDQAALIEIAKIAAARDGEGTSQNIQNYRIQDQRALIEIAKIAAAQNGEITSAFIRNYDIQDQAALIEIARIAAAQDGGETSRFIQNYGIQDQKTLIEIAKIAAAQDGGGTSQYIQRYHIQNPEALIEIAKTAATQDGCATSIFIQYYGIQDQKAIISIAEIAAAHDGEGLTDHIPNYRIQDQEALIRIAQIAAAQNGRGVSEQIHNFEIQDHEALIKIAKIAAAQDGWGTSAYIHKYGFQDQKALVQIAEIAASQNGKGTLSFLNNYGIQDPEAIFKICLIALNQSPTYETFNLCCKITNLKLNSEDQPIQDPAALRAWLEARLANQGLPPSLADVVFADTQRQTSTLILAWGLVWLIQSPEGKNFVHDMASQYSLSHVSRYLLTHMTGLFMGTSLGKAFSSRALSDFYQSTLNIQAGLGEPAFKGIIPQEDLFQDRSLRALSEFLNSLMRLKGILASDAQAEWPGIRRKIQDAGLNRATIPYLIEEMDRDFMERFTAAFFLNGAAAFSIDQIKRLEEAWGDLNVFHTLVARFRGNFAWKSEIPLLAQVVRAVLNGSFHELKYAGSKSNLKDQRNAQAQLQGLKTEEALKAWQANYQTVGIFSAHGTEGQKSLEDLWRASRDPIEQTYAHVLEISHNLDETAAERILNELQQKLSIETLRKYKKNTLEYRWALFKILYDCPDAHSYRNVLNFIKSKRSLLKLNRQIEEDLKTLDAALSLTETPKEAIVFTTTTDDPKLLLMTGDLVGVSSCQNYKTGSHIQTLLGYVVDAGVKLMLSYGLMPQHFKTKKDFDTAKKTVRESPEQITFQAALQKLKIGDIEIDLPRAVSRRVIKLGTTEEGEAGLFMEREYAQNHMAERLIKNQIESVHQGLARSIKAHTRRKIKITATRNPGGVYSDASKGIMKGPYELSPTTKPNTSPLEILMPVWGVSGGIVTALAR